MRPCAPIVKVGHLTQCICCGMSTATYSESLASLTIDSQLLFDVTCLITASAVSIDNIELIASLLDGCALSILRPVDLTCYCPCHPRCFLRMQVQRSNAQPGFAFCVGLTSCCGFWVVLWLSA